MLSKLHPHCPGGLICILSPLSQGTCVMNVIHILLPCSQMSVSFSDCLGSKVFSVIKSDINGNITASIDMSVYLRVQSVFSWQKLHD